MKSFSLVVLAVVLFAAFAQGAERDCSTKCACSNVPNKTEFCGILGIKRVTFSSSCEMLCFNCQNKSNFKYQSPGKCPADTTPVPAAVAAQAALPTTKRPKAQAPLPLPSSTTTHKPKTQ